MRNTVYDFEAILKPTLVKHGDNTTFTNEHIPVSVSVADSLTEEVCCFVNDDPKALHTDIFKCIASVVVKIQRYNVDKCERLLREIIAVHGMTGMEIPGIELGIIYTISDVDNLIKRGRYGSFFDFHNSIGLGKQWSDYGKIKQQID
ncbi:hypothetical protein PC110_g10553 [Phytophthora cactorum]|uniref:Uncharacterized protein n=1 Tax=Phytophthora cactorum TaxID=29920 RepID=A0A329S8S6_9STRA|nr:hypothetical protein PC110_g10553 [Phytophthora cactorum]